MAVLILGSWDAVGDLGSFLVAILFIAFVWAIPLGVLIAAVRFFRHWRVEQRDRADRAHAQRSRIIELLEAVERDRRK